MRKFSFSDSRFNFIEGIGTINLERVTSSLVHVFWFQMLWSIRTCIYSLWFLLYVNEFPPKKKRKKFQSWCSWKCLAEDWSIIMGEMCFRWMPYTWKWLSKIWLADDIIGARFCSCELLAGWFCDRLQSCNSLLMSVLDDDEKLSYMWIVRSS